jgi:ribosomal protein S18 acetylase RimI-like enzyme
MHGSEHPQAHAARAEELQDAGRLLDAFNREFGEPTPGAAWLAERLGRLIGDGDTVVLVAGDGPDGVAVLRLRRSLWGEGLECYLAELYVAPERRRRGLGRALLEAALVSARERGAEYIDLNTAETDVAARALYERLGFSNNEGKPHGPVNHYYEREL